VWGGKGGGVGGRAPSPPPATAPPPHTSAFRAKAASSACGNLRPLHTFGTRRPTRRHATSDPRHIGATPPRTHTDTPKRRYATSDPRRNAETPPRTPTETPQRRLGPHLTGPKCQTRPNRPAQQHPKAQNRLDGAAQPGVVCSHRPPQDACFFCSLPRTWPLRFLLPAAAAFLLPVWRL
jgi:hypothetical protein